MTATKATPKIPAEVEKDLSEDLKAARSHESAMRSVEVECWNGSGETTTKTLHFKSLTLVPLGIVRKTRRDYSEQMWAIFEWALDPEDLDVLDQIPSDKLDDLLAAMQKASGTTPGES